MPIEKNLQEIIDVVAEGTVAVAAVLKDGFQYTDIFALIPTFSKIPQAIEDADQAWAYLKDLTEEKENEIIAAVLAKIPTAPVKTKQLVKFILRELANAYMIYLIATSNQEGV